MLVDLRDIRVRDAYVPEDRPSISVTERLPQPLKKVVAISPAFRCLAYIDTFGVWRHDSDDKEIEGVFAWKEYP